MFRFSDQVWKEMQMGEVVTILTSASGHSLVKSFSGEELSQQPFSTGSLFNVSEEPVSDLQSLSALLQRLENDPKHTVIRGSLMNNQSKIAILPLHDSFLMHYGYETSPGPVMRAAFEEVIGTLPVIDRKEAAKRNNISVSKSSDKLALNAADGLNDLLAELDVGYENRLEAFRRLSSSNFMK